MFGDQHPTTLAGRHNFAAALYAMGNCAECAELGAPESGGLGLWGEVVVSGVRVLNFVLLF